MVFDIKQKTWGSPANLFNSAVEMVPSDDATSEPKIIEGDTQVTLRDNKFLITWSRRRAPVSLHSSYFSIFLFFFFCLFAILPL